MADTEAQETRMKRFLITALLILATFSAGAVPAFAAISFDNASTGTSASSATDSFALTVGTGANRILWVGFLVNNGPQPTISSVKYAGVSMTATVGNPLPVGASSQYLYLYYLAAPASGANNVVITFTGSVLNISAMASSYAGAAQTGIPDASVSGTGTGTSATLSTTTTADNAWMVGVFRNNSTGNGSAGSGTTQRAAVSGQVSFDDSGGPLTPPGSHSIQTTWTGSAAYYALGASFAPFIATPIPGVTGTFKGITGTFNGLTVIFP